MQGTLHAQGPSTAITHETEDIFVAGMPIHESKNLI